MNTALERNFTLGRKGLRVFIGISFGYLLLSAFAKSSITTPDSPTFWVPTAEMILSGNWLDIFSHRYQAFDLEFPNSFPVIYYFLLTIPIAMAKWLGMDPSLGGSVFQTFLLGFFDVFAAYQLSLLASEIKKESEVDWTPGVLYLTGFTTAFATLGMMHQEGIILFLCFCFLRSLLNGKDLQSVIYGSLLLLMKLTSILVIVPIGIWLLAKDIKRGAIILASIIAVFLLVLSPYFLFRFEDTWYSLVEFESFRIIVGVTPMKWFVGTEFESIIIRFSNILLVLISIIISCISYIYFRKCLHSPMGLWILMCSALLIPFFGKWVYTHYLQVGFGLMLLWNETVSNAKNRLLFPLSFCGAAYILQGIRIPDILNQVSPEILFRSIGWTIFSIFFLLISFYVSKQTKIIND